MQDEGDRYVFQTRIRATAWQGNAKTKGRNRAMSFPRWYKVKSMLGSIVRVVIIFYVLTSINFTTAGTRESDDVLDVFYPQSREDAVSLDRLKRHYGDRLETDDGSCHHKDLARAWARYDTGCVFWRVNQVKYFSAVFDKATYRLRLDGSVKSLNLRSSGDCAKILTTFFEFIRPQRRFFREKEEIKEIENGGEITIDLKLNLWSSSRSITLSFVSGKDCDVYYDDSYK